MTKTPSRLFMSIVFSCTAFMLQTAYAEQASIPVTTPNKLLVQLPKVDSETLIEKLMTLRNQLIEFKQALVQIVEDRKPDSGDALITAIMPGGLLYGGYKQARYEQAKDELEQVNADIEELSGDLLAMQSMTAPAVVAQLY